MAATAGVATFSGCQIVGPVGTYTLTATDSTSGSVTPATSFVFTINGRPADPPGVHHPTKRRPKRGAPGPPSPSSPSRTAVATPSPPPPTPSAWPSPVGRRPPTSPAMERPARPWPPPPAWPPSAAVRSPAQRCSTPSPLPTLRCSGATSHRPDHSMSRRPSPARDDRGTSLILALVFVFVIGMVLVAVGGLAANALLNTSNARANGPVQGTRTPPSRSPCSISGTTPPPTLRAPSCLPPNSTIPSSDPAS